MTTTTPRLARHICLAAVNIPAHMTDPASASAPSLAIAHLLDDLADALRVYDRLTRQGTEASETPIELTRLVPGDIRQQPSPIPSCDALVCGLALAGDRDDPGDIRAAIREILRACMPGTRIYAISCSSTTDRSVSREHLMHLMRACEKARCTWSGGLALNDAAAIAAQTCAPRMGILRRTRSEAIDRLIMAVRCGIPLDTDGPAHVLVVQPTRSARLLTYLHQRA